PDRRGYRAGSVPWQSARAWLREPAQRTDSLAEPGRPAAAHQRVGRPAYGAQPLLSSPLAGLAADGHGRPHAVLPNPLGGGCRHDVAAGADGLREDDTAADAGGAVPALPQGVSLLVR